MFQRRRHYQRRRILRSAEYRQYGKSSSSVSRRRQRLRNFCSGGTSNARRKYFEAARELSAHAHRRMRRHRAAGELCIHETRRGALPCAQRSGVGSFARHSSLFAFSFRRRKTLPLRNRARSKNRVATPSRSSASFWSAKASSKKANSTLWKRKSIAKLVRLLTAHLPLNCPPRFHLRMGLFAGR